MRVKCTTCFSTVDLVGGFCSECGSPLDLAQVREIFEEIPFEGDASRLAREAYEKWLDGEEDE